MIDRKFNIPVRRRVVLVASAEGLLHVFDQRWLSSRAGQSARQVPSTTGGIPVSEKKEVLAFAEGVEPGLGTKLQSVPGQDKSNTTNGIKASQNKNSVSADNMGAGIDEQSQLLAGADVGTRSEKDSSSRDNIARSVPASATKAITPVIQISIPYNATALVLDSSRKISRIFVGTDEGDVIAYDFTGNVEENFTYIATLVKRASWKVDSGVTSFCLTNGGRSQGANCRNTSADAAGDGQVTPLEWG